MIMLMIGVLLSSLIPLFYTQHAAIGQTQTGQLQPALNIGDYIQFGNLYNKPILWRVIHKEPNGNPILLSDRILSLKAFDAAGSYHPLDYGTNDAMNRHYNGSNYYPDSNIRQWLNSNSMNSGADQIDWIQNEPSAGNLWGGYNPYHTESGFLSPVNFKPAELQMIKPLTQSVILANFDSNKKDAGNELHIYESEFEKAVTNDESAYSKYVTDRVFMLSLKQLKEYVYDRFGINYVAAKPTAEAVTNSTFQESGLTPNANWNYWLNTPEPVSSTDVRLVDGTMLSSFPAYGSAFGIRPALQLDMSVTTFTGAGDGTAGTPYVVGEPVPPPPPTYKLGDYIRFGQYNGEPILWRIIHKNELGNPILLSDRILTLKAFDANGNYHINLNRKSFGSNYYPDSNLRQWLNSSRSNGGTDLIDWIQNDPTATNLFSGYNPYHTERGFLANGNFSSLERNLIQPLNHQVVISNADSAKRSGGSASHVYETETNKIVQNYYSTAFYKMVTDHVFLLSAAQLHEFVLMNRYTLGADYHLAKPTAAAVQKSNYSDPQLSSGSYWKYWLNTAYGDFSASARYVNEEGLVPNEYTDTGYIGVRPALQLDAAKLTFAVNGTGTAANPYEISLPVTDFEAPTVPDGLATENVTNTGITLNWNAATDNVGVSGYQVFRDGELLATVKEPTYTFAGLSDFTSYALTVKAIDEAANLSEASTPLVVRTLDKLAPAAPSGLTASDVTREGFTIRWNPSQDNSGVVKYAVFLNDFFIKFVNDTSFTYDNAVDYTEYTVKVQAADESMNFSADSETLKVRTSDGIPPAEPKELKVSELTRAGFTVSWQAGADNVAVNGYEVYRDGIPVETVTGTSYTFSGLTDVTTAVITVKTVDHVGLKSLPSQPLTVKTLDGLSPTKPSGLVAKNIIPSGFSLSWDPATDNVGTVAYEVYLDGQFSIRTPSTFHTFSGLADNRTYVVTTKAVDAAGNVSPSSDPVSATTTDGTAPSVPVGLKATNITGDGFVVSWNAAADNAGVSFYEVFRDGVRQAQVPATSFEFYELGSAVNYQIKVRAWDASGNVSAFSDVLQVRTPDMKQPTVPAGLAASNVTTSGVRLTWSAATDNAGVTGYEIYRGSTLVQTVPASLTTLFISGLSPGTDYWFAVRARDAAGNRSGLSALVRVQTMSRMDVVGRSISINGKPLNLGPGVQPVTINGSIMVPFRPIFETLGLRVSYNATTKTIEGSKPGYILRLVLNSRTAVINGRTNKTVPVAPTLVNRTTMVPLRFVGEELGLLVTYRSR